MPKMPNSSFGNWAPQPPSMAGNWTTQPSSSGCPMQPPMRPVYNPRTPYFQPQPLNVYMPTPQQPPSSSQHSTTITTSFSTTSGFSHYTWSLQQLQSGSQTQELLIM